MNSQRYLIHTPAQTDLLEDWRWLVGPTLRFWRATTCGDAFLIDAGTGAMHFLDTGAGKVEKVADTPAEFERKLSDPECAEGWLLTGLVDAAAARGLSLGPGQCYSFKIPSILGGGYTVQNLGVCLFDVHFALLGQIHEKLKDLPAGAPVRFEISD